MRKLASKHTSSSMRRSLLKHESENPADMILTVCLAEDAVLTANKHEKKSVAVVGCGSTSSTKLMLQLAQQ